MKLALLQFIKTELLFEDRKPLTYHSPIKPGTEVRYNGSTYEAVAQETLGWTWRAKDGRSPEKNPTLLFKWDDPIYQASRFEPLRKSPTPADKPVKDELGRKSEIVNVPEKLQDPAEAWAYAKYTMGGKRCPELEYFIAKSPKYSYLYANNILKDRFWKAEPTIATKVDWAVPYAINVMGARWKEIEPMIHQFPYFVDQYSKAFNLQYDPATKTFR